MNLKARINEGVNRVGSQFSKLIIRPWLYNVSNTRRAKVKVRKLRLFLFYYTVKQNVNY